MNKKYLTDQETFWAGQFGDEYTDRNTGPNWIASNMALFVQILSRTNHVRSVLELGANRGLNLVAIRQLLPEAKISAVEINQKAVQELRAYEWLNVSAESILNFHAPEKSDFVFVKGVMIHLNPDVLPTVYQTIYDSSARYICIIEYYNPTPVSVPYRGHEDRLFKRDFAREIMQFYPDLALVDYGFVYRGDANFPQDDLTWFLLEKSS